jgi:hypothetical protein
VTALQLGQPGVGGGELLFELDGSAVAQLGGFAKVGGALGPFGVGPGFLEPRLERSDATDDLFLLVPSRPQRRAPLGQPGQLTF